MTDEEYKLCVHDKKRELFSLEMFIDKFLGIRWKQKGGDPLVKIALELSKEKLYLINIKHHKDSYASRHERLEAMAMYEEE